MKKIGILFVTILIILNLAACSSKESEDKPTASVRQDTTLNTQEASGEAEEATKESQAEAADTTSSQASDTSDTKSEPAQGKTLVVYYSATGNTKDVAQYIAAATDGDVFELEPVDAYSSDDLNWTDDDSRVVYEHDNPDARAVELKASTVQDWESYDTVFIGYPIWWGIAAWPVDTFIEANDFTGKTVIPFCTSSSSGLGESGELLAKAAGTGNWLEGERFSSRASEESVKEWVEKLGL